MIQIKLLKDWRTKKKGEIINISKKGANQFVEAGAAEYLDIEKENIQGTRKWMAFKEFKEIEKLETLQEKQRAWLKRHTGKKYGYSLDGFMRKGWEWTKTFYRDDLFESDINLIGRRDNEIIIEFDDDIQKSKEHIEETEKRLKSLDYGYIRSTHNGKCDYLWLQFTKPIKDKDAQKFAVWISPPDSKVDLNLTSSNKIFPVLFAIHRKHSMHREMPVTFSEGNQIDLSKIPEIKNIVVNPIIEKKENGFEYETAHKPLYSDEEIKNALENFKKPELLSLIREELSKTHLEDDNLKMTGFFTAVSGLSHNPDLRKSIALRGDSSVGKDNMIKAIFKQLPEDTNLFFTSATQSILEDDTHQYNVLGFSEVNANREAGANKFIVEAIKQMAEGGMFAGKKDIRSGNMEVRFEKGEQKSIFYGTTETETDDELQTRFIVGTVQARPERIKKVNDNTLDCVADQDKLLEVGKKEDSWIKKGLTYFVDKKEKYIVILPYAKFLKEEIDGEPIFDNSNPRSQRDLKRILALTCAVTYLFQEQREKIEYKGNKFLVSEVSDFIETLKYSIDFFNQSYQGYDARMDEVYKLITQSWTARDLVQEKLGISRNTIKERCQILSEQGIIKGQKGVNLNQEGGVKLFDGNKIYYKRCQKGVKKPLVRCQIDKLREFLEQQDLTPLKKDDLSTIKEENINKKGVKKKVSNSEEEEEKIKNSEKINEKRVKINEINKNFKVGDGIDTLELTPLIENINFEESGI